MKAKPEIYLITGSESKMSEYSFWLQDHARLRWRNIAFESPLTLNTDLLLRRKVGAGKIHLPGLPFLVEQTVLFFNATKELHLPGTLTGRFLKTVGIKGVCNFMDGFSDKSALVRSDLAYHDTNGETFYFQSEKEGEIACDIGENAGHGWQPIFIPKGHSLPFSELKLDEKIQYSTRYEVAAMLTHKLNMLNEDELSGLSIEARARLLNQIHTAFEFDKITELCFLLGIDKDEIMPPGTSKTQAIMNLIGYCGQQQMTNDLLKLCQNKRPRLDWSF